MSQDEAKGEGQAVPVDAAGYLGVVGELPRLAIPANAVSPLRKLGPSPFPKSGFPTLGFLESVYEHIEGRAKARGGGGAEPTAADH
jgi:hypothetical protein